MLFFFNHRFRHSGEGTDLGNLVIAPKAGVVQRGVAVLIDGVDVCLVVNQLKGKTQHVNIRCSAEGCCHAH